jgi:hypothetical protein
MSSLLLLHCDRDFKASYQQCLTLVMQRMETILPQHDHIDVYSA